MTAIISLLKLIPRSVLVAMIGVLLALQALTTVKLFEARIETARAERAASILSLRSEQERANAAELLARAQGEARKKEQDLQQFADQQRKSKDAEITRLRNDVRDLRYGLSNLPSRPTGGVAAPALGGSAAGGCPGPILYRETGEDLVSEAERAETIRLELIRLYELWGKARAVTAAP